MLSINPAQSASAQSKQIVLNHRLFEVLLVAFCYFIFARVGQIFAIPPGNITPVWLPSGLMVAWALIRGPGIWPGVFLGAFAGNIWAYFSFESWSLALAALCAGLCNGAGDVLSTVGAVQLLSLLGNKKGLLIDFRDYALFIFLVAILGAAVSAVFGVSSLSIMGFIAWQDYWTTMLTWWTGDAVGVLLLAPFIFSCYEALKRKGLYANWHFIVLVVISVFLASILFKLFAVPHWLFLLSYAVAPIVIIISLYLGQLSCFSSLLAFAAIAVIATHKTIGPFASSSQNLSLLELQIFIAVLSFVICMLSITVRQHLEAEKQAKANAKSLTQAQQIAHLGSWQLDLRNQALEWSDEVYRIFEINPENFEPTYEQFLATIHPEDKEYVHQAYSESLKNKKPYEIEHRLLMPDGRVKYVHERGETLFN